MKPSFVVFCLLCLGLLGAARAQSLDTDRDPARLKYDLLPGKTYVQTTELAQTTLLEMQGQKIHQKMDMTMVLSMAVEAVPEGKAVTVTYDRISMKQDMGGNAFSFDSANPDSDDAASPLSGMSALLGKPFRVILGEEGEIISIAGVDELIESVGGPMSREMVKQFAGEDQLAQMMNTFMSAMVPARPVAPGDTWPIDLDMSIPPFGEATYKGSGKLLGYQDLDGHDVAVLEIEARTGLRISEKPSDEGEAPPRRP